MSKILDGLKEALAFSECEHLFIYIGPHRFGNGETAKCPRCRCRVTAWPGTIHYDEIVAARDATRSRGEE